jgi:hypothetical protein
MEEGSLGMTVEGGLRLLADMGASDEVAPLAALPVNPRRGIRVGSAY